MLMISPTDLVCPFCEAKPGQDCATTSWDGLIVIHVARIKAAALIDKKRKINQSV
jgi:RNA polymerase subunit RPABC4/transcription elongation factor Spt4